MLSYREYLERRQRRERMQQSGSFVGEGGTPSYPTDEEIAALDERRQQEHDDLIRAEEIRGVESSVEPYVDVDPIAGAGPVKSFAKYLEERQARESGFTSDISPVFSDARAPLEGAPPEERPSLTEDSRTPGLSLGMITTDDVLNTVSELSLADLFDPERDRELKRYHSYPAAMAQSHLMNVARGTAQTLSMAVPALGGALEAWGLWAGAPSMEKAGALLKDVATPDEPIKMKEPSFMAIAEQSNVDSPADFVHAMDRYMDWMAETIGQTLGFTGQLGAAAYVAKPLGKLGQYAAGGAYLSTQMTGLAFEDVVRIREEEKGRRLKDEERVEAAEDAVVLGVANTLLESAGLLSMGFLKPLSGMIKNQALRSKILEATIDRARRIPNPTPTRMAEKAASLLKNVKKGIDATPEKARMLLVGGIGEGGTELSQFALTEEVSREFGIDWKKPETWREGVDNFMAGLAGGVAMSAPMPTQTQIADDAARASVVQPKPEAQPEPEAQAPVAVEAEWDVEAPPIVEPAVQPEPEIKPPVVPEVQPTPEVVPEPETAPPVLEDDAETVSAEEVADLFADDDLNVIQPPTELPAPLPEQVEPTVEQATIDDPSVLDLDALAEAEPSNVNAERRAEIERTFAETGIPEPMLEALRRRMEGATAEELDAMLAKGQEQATLRQARENQEDERVSFLGKTQNLYGGSVPFTAMSTLDDGTMVATSIQPIDPDSPSDGWRVVADVAGEIVDPVEFKTYQSAIKHAQEEYGAELDEGVVEFQADPIEQAQITPEVIPEEDLRVPTPKRRRRATQISISQMFTGRLASGQMEEAERLTGKVDDPTVRRFWGRLRAKEGGTHLAEALSEAWDGPDRAVLEGAGISGPDDVDGFAQALTDRNKLFHKTAVDPDMGAEDLWDEEQRRRAEEAGEQQYDDEVPFEPSRVRNKSKERRVAEKFTRDDMAASAVSEFGLTENPVEAGYILPDGSMLNFSGGEPNQRGIDHRGIALLGQDFETGEGEGMLFNTIAGVGHDSGYMLDFMNRGGAVRIAAMSNDGRGNIDWGLVDIIGPVSKPQLRRLMKTFKGAPAITIDHGRMEEDPNYDDGRQRYIQVFSTQLDMPTAGDMMRAFGHSGTDEGVSAVNRPFQHQYETPTLVSKVIGVVNKSIKNKMPGEVALRVLQGKDKGLGPDLYWSGLDIWLKERGKEKVTGEDIIEYANKYMPTVDTYQAGTARADGREKPATLKLVGPGRVRTEWSIDVNSAYVLMGDKAIRSAKIFESWSDEERSPWEGAENDSGGRLGISQLTPDLQAEFLRLAERQTGKTILPMQIVLGRGPSLTGEYAERLSLPDEDRLSTIARLSEGDKQRLLTLKHRSLSTDRSPLMDRADYLFDDMPFASREEAELFANNMQVFDVDDEPIAYRLAIPVERPVVSFTLADPQEKWIEYEVEIALPPLGENMQDLRKQLTTGMVGSAISRVRVRVDPEKIPAFRNVHPNAPLDENMPMSQLWYVLTHGEKIVDDQYSDLGMIDFEDVNPLLGDEERALWGEGRERDTWGHIIMNAPEKMVERVFGNMLGGEQQNNKLNEVRAAMGKFAAYETDKEINGLPVQGGRRSGAEVDLVIALLSGEYDIGTSSNAESGAIGGEANVMFLLEAMAASEQGLARTLAAPFLLPDHTSLGGSTDIVPSDYEGVRATKEASRGGRQFTNTELQTVHRTIMENFRHVEEQYQDPSIVGVLDGSKLKEVELHTNYRPDDKRNYREFVFSANLPYADKPDSPLVEIAPSLYEARQAAAWDAGHFTVPGVNIGHVRTFDEMSKDGKRYLMLWEIQSDPVAGIRTYGTPAMKDSDSARVTEIENQLAELMRQQERAGYDAVVEKGIYPAPPDDKMESQIKNLKAERNRIYQRMNSNSAYRATPMPWDKSNQVYQMMIRNMARIALEQGYDGMLLPEGRRQWEINNEQGTISFERPMGLPVLKTAAKANRVMALRWQDEENEMGLGRDVPFLTTRTVAGMEMGKIPFMGGEGARREEGVLLDDELGYGTRWDMAATGRIVLPDFSAISVRSQGGPMGDFTYEQDEKMADIFEQDALVGFRVSREKLQAELSARYKEEFAIEIPEWLTYINLSALNLEGRDAQPSTPEQGDDEMGLLLPKARLKFAIRRMLDDMVGWVNGLGSTSLDDNSDIFIGIPSGDIHHMMSSYMREGENGIIPYKYGMAATDAAAPGSATQGSLPRTGKKRATSRARVETEAAIAAGLPLLYESGEQSRSRVLKRDYSALSEEDYAMAKGIAKRQSMMRGKSRDEWIIDFYSRLTNMPHYDTSTAMASQMAMYAQYIPQSRLMDVEDARFSPASFAVGGGTHWRVQSNAGIYYRAPRIDNDGNVRRAGIISIGKDINYVREGSMRAADLHGTPDNVSAIVGNNLSITSGNIATALMGTPLLDRYRIFDDKSLGDRTYVPLTGSEGMWDKLPASSDWNKRLGVVSPTLKGQMVPKSLMHEAGAGIKVNDKIFANAQEMEAHFNEAHGEGVKKYFKNADDLWAYMQEKGNGMYSEHLNSFQQFYEVTGPALLKELAKRIKGIPRKKGADGSGGISTLTNKLEQEGIQNLGTEHSYSGIEFGPESKEVARKGQGLFETSAPMRDKEMSNGMPGRPIRTDNIIEESQKLSAASGRKESLEESERGVKDLAQAVTRSLDIYKQVVWDTIKGDTAQGRAKIFQAARNPFLEHIRYVIVDGDTGEFMSEFAWTSKETDHVGDYFDVAGASDGREGTMQKKSRDKLKQILSRHRSRASNKNIKVYMVHNHPSGVATPSAPDVKFHNDWSAVVNSVDGVTAGDHVIVNAGEYAVMDDDGYTLFDLETHETLATQEEMETDQGLPWLDERRQKARERDAILGRASRSYTEGVKKEWLSQTVDSREAVARIAKELEVPGDYVGVMIQDSQLYVRGLTSLPVDTVRDLGPDGFKAWAKEQSLRFGGRNVTAFYGAEGAVQMKSDEFLGFFKPLVADGSLEDALHLPSKYQASLDKNMVPMPQRRAYPAVAVGEPAKVMRRTRKAQAVPGMTVSNSPDTKKAAADNLTRADQLREAIPVPLESEETWMKFMSSIAQRSKTMLKSPYGAIAMRDPAVIVDAISKISPEQMADKRAGFDLTKKTRERYIAGKMTTNDTAAYMVWSMLSRGLPPYEQESMFADVMADPKFYEFVDMAVKGNFTTDDTKTIRIKDAPDGSPRHKTRPALAAWDEWVEEVNRRSKIVSSPGASATSPLQDFGYGFSGKFLFEASQRVDEEMAARIGGHKGNTVLQAWHDMTADPDMTGRKLRRNFHVMFDRPGMDNKLVSFYALAVGFDDLIILDRVRARDLWDSVARVDDFRNINIYEAKEFAQQMKGPRGVAILEALEDGLRQPIIDAYDQMGRPDDSAMGSWHWEAWVVESNQEVSHGSLEMMDRKALGKRRGSVPTKAAREGIMTREGKYSTFYYGAEYGYVRGKPVHIYRTADGVPYIFTGKGLRDFTDELAKHAKTRVLTNEMERAVPHGFKVSEDFRFDPQTGESLPREAEGFPWINHPGVNRQNIDNLVGRYGRLPTDLEAQSLRLTDAQQRALRERRPPVETAAVHEPRREFTRGAGGPPSQVGPETAERLAGTVVTEDLVSGRPGDTEPLVLYRGEHGGTKQFNTDLGVPTFTDVVEAANQYAMWNAGPSLGEWGSDLARDMEEGEQGVRVLPYYVKITNPVPIGLLNGRDHNDPFIAWHEVEEALPNASEATLDAIYEEAGFGDQLVNPLTPDWTIDLMRRNKSQLEVISYAVADSPSFQSAAKNEGYDGLITIGPHGQLDPDFFRGRDQDWRADPAYALRDYETMVEDSSFDPDEKTLLEVRPFYPQAEDAVIDIYTGVREEGREFDEEEDPSLFQGGRWAGDESADPEAVWNAFFNPGEQTPPAEVELPTEEAAPEAEPTTVPPGQKEYSFPLTAEGEGYEKGENLFYTPITNKETEDEARQILSERGVQGALADMMERTEGQQPEAIDMAIAVGAMAVYRARMNQARESGDEQGVRDNARAQGEIVAFITDKTKQAGQFINQVKLLKRLSPETMLIYAERKIDNLNRQRTGKQVERGEEVVLDDETRDQIQLLGETTEMFEGLSENGEAVFEITERALRGEEVSGEDVELLRGYIKEVGAAMGIELAAEVKQSKKKKKGRRTAIDRIVGEVVGKKVEAARARLRERGVEIRMNIDPRDVRDYTIIGVGTMLETGNKFRDWATAMQETIPGLEFADARELWGLTRDMMSEERSRARRIYAQSKAISDLLSAAESYPTLTEEDAVVLAELSAQLREAVGDKQTELAQELGAILGGLEKPDFADKARAWQTMSMLLNPKTQVRNIGGNEMFWYMQRLSRIAATGVDFTLSAGAQMVGKDRPRTVTFRTGWSPTRPFQGHGGYVDYFRGLRKGARAAWRGEDPYGLGGKFDLPQLPSFREPGWVAQGINKIPDHLPGGQWQADFNLMGYFERTLGVLLKGFDFAAFERARTRYYAEHAYLDAMNQGVPSKDRADFVARYVANADRLEADVQEAAEQFGLYMTFQDDTPLSDAAVGLKRKLNELVHFPIPGAQRPFGLGDFSIKFPKTPMNLFDRAADYSPYGFYRAYNEFRRPWTEAGGASEVDQEKVIMAAVTASVGTVGLTGFGAWLLTKGVLLGSGEDDDETRRILREEAGIAPYSANVSALWRLGMGGGPETAERRKHDTYYTYNWMQPMAISLVAGADAAAYVTKEMQKAERVDDPRFEGMGADEAWTLESMTNLLRAMFVGGTQAFLDNPMVGALGDLVGGRGSLGHLAVSAPGTMVPTALKMFADLYDPIRREAYRGDPLQKALNIALSKVPIIRQQGIDLEPLLSLSKIPPQYRTLGSRDEEGRPIMTTNPETGEEEILVEPVPIYSGAEDESPAFRIFNIFLNPGFKSIYNPDPMIEMLLRPYEELGTTTQMPRRQPKKLRLGRSTKTPTVELRAEDYATLQKYMAQNITERLADFDPEELKKLDPEDQLKILAKEVNASAADTRDYWYDNLAYKYDRIPDEEQLPILEPIQ